MVIFMYVHIYVYIYLQLYVCVYVIILLHCHYSCQTITWCSVLIGPHHWCQWYSLQYTTREFRDHAGSCLWQRHCRHPEHWTTREGVYVGQCYVCTYMCIFWSCVTWLNAIPLILAAPQIVATELIRLCTICTNIDTHFSVQTLGHITFT